MGRVTMLGRLARLASPLGQQVRHHGHHPASMDGAAGGVFEQCCGKCLPQYNPARAIPMKWGVVYMAVFMGFWGLCYTVSPFRERQHMTLSYEEKWKTSSYTLLQWKIVREMSSQHSVKRS